jgi:choice-of-anchor B domain-containing protein
MSSMPRVMARVAVFALAGAAACAFAHDEDWRKLAGRQPAFQGEIYRHGQAAPRNVSFNSQGVTLLSWFPLNTFAGAQGAGNDCWGYVSPSGREYAIMGLEKGFGFVEITDPINAQILTTITGPASIWHDVKVIDQYAYGVSEGGSGVQVMDLRNIDSGVVTLVRNWQTGGHSTTHNIAANPVTGYIYLTGANIANGGLVAMNARGNPGAPPIAGSWSQMYVHDAQVVSYTSGPFAGREIAFCASGFGGGFTSTGLRIVDVTNKSNMFTISEVFYPSSSYSHQVWLSEDRRFIYLNDELDESDGKVATTTTRIINVEDLNNPFFVGTFTSGRTAIDHNLYVKGNTIYQANYTSGIRVFDNSDPTAPVEYAFFDTIAEFDSPQGFNGTWSVFPYFPSGTVIASDIEKGLFVFEVQPPERLDIALVGTQPSFLEPGSSIQADVTERGLATDPATVRLTLQLPSGDVTVPGSPVSGTPGRFSFTLPNAMPCFATVPYYITAQATTGASFTAPSLGSSQPFTATVADGLTPVFTDNFETNLGWTVASTATDGQWARGFAQQNDRGDPWSDGDGSGLMYLTDPDPNSTNSDVDNGQTTLTSPVLNLPDGGIIAYFYWLNDVPNGRLSPEDGLFVELSTNNGSTWTRVREHKAASFYWRTDTLDTRALVGPSAQTRVRFVAADLGDGGVVEAAVDGVAVSDFDCTPPSCPADLTGDGQVDSGDLSAFITAFLAADPSADLTGDGQVDSGDLATFIPLFLAGC